MQDTNFKNTYTENKLSLQAIVAGVVLSCTFFLILLDLNKSYVSTMTILVIPKSEIVSNNQRQVIANIQQLPTTLSFYEILLKNNSDIRDFATGNSKDAKKKNWNKIISVKLSDKNSSVIDISIKSKSQNDSELLVQKTTRTLFDTASKYYNIKNDVDFRIIEGSITKSDLSAIWWILPLGLLLGFSIAIVLQKLIISFEKRFIHKSDIFQNFPKKEKKEKYVAPQAEIKEEIFSLDDLYKTEQMDTPFSFEQYQEAEFLFPTENEVSQHSLENSLPEEQILEIDKHIQKNMYPNFPEMPIVASAPDNLPVADEEMLKEILKQEPEKAPAKEEALDREPTQEELKKRLNQLLKGKL
jgi:hypothetical protein